MGLWRFCVGALVCVASRVWSVGGMPCAHTSRTCTPVGPGLRDERWCDACYLAFRGVGPPAWVRSLARHRYLGTPLQRPTQHAHVPHIGISPAANMSRPSMPPYSEPFRNLSGPCSVLAPIPNPLHAMLPEHHTPRTRAPDVCVCLCACRGPHRPDPAVRQRGNAGSGHAGAWQGRMCVRVIDPSPLPFCCPPTASHAHHTPASMTHVLLDHHTPPKRPEASVCGVVMGYALHLNPQVAADLTTRPPYNTIHRSQIASYHLPA
jgi:hypothetical protein